MSRPMATTGSEEAYSGEPTSGLENRLPLLQLRVIAQALQGCAGDCKCPIYRGVSLPCLAQCCTVLRSRRYQDERQLQSDSRSNGTHSRPSEPQSADTRFQALPYVAESACLSQFLCSRLPAGSRCCALTSVCVSSDPARECSS